MADPAGTGTVLVLAEPGGGSSDGGGFPDGARELFGAAASLAGDSGRVVAVVPVGDAGEVPAAGLAADEAFVVSGPESADHVAAALHAAVKETGADAVLIPHAPGSWDAAPLLAARLGVAVATGALAMSREPDGVRVVRRAFQGKFLQEVLLPGGRPAVITVEPGAFPPSEARRSKGVKARPLPSFEFDPANVLDRVVETREAGDSKVDLGGADVVVSAGRGLGSPDNLHLVEELAEALGGSVGGSRAVTDAGWMPHDRQIGSSGVAVSPKLYVACGISGAIQHVVGMRGARFVVAINKDPDAPIFEVADVGVEGDVLEILPALAAAVRSARN